MSTGHGSTPGLRRYVGARQIPRDDLRWGLPLWLCVLATGFFFLVDVTFFAANAVKVVDGGWFPLLIGAGMFTLMLTWKQGRRQLSAKLREDAIELPAFLEAVFNPGNQIPVDTGVF